MKSIVLAATLLLAPCLAQAQPAPAHSPTMMHGIMPGGPAQMAAHPTEAGQSAFAAIQEIVALLEADPATDWSKVNIEALRQHLIDMNAVTLEATAVAEPIAGGVRFQVSGNDPVCGSIRRMVMAHAATMNGVGGWAFKADETSAGAVLTVTVADPAEVRGGSARVNSVSVWISGLCVLLRLRLRAVD